ncbi:hypothetical protein [Paenibacillus sp. FSL E2-0178]|uniref:hypothetical protein n=1 Tax=Paenibacillus sp. FSL E2-0178 TaxID=2921361 RepID=UPI003158915A
MFGKIIHAIDTVLYIFKFMAYALIAMYLWGQMKAGDMPNNEKVADFLKWTDNAMLPFLMYAAACEALHILLRPFIKLSEMKEARLKIFKI